MSDTQDKYFKLVRSQKVNRTRLGFREYYPVKKMEELYGRAD